MKSIKLLAGIAVSAVGLSTAVTMGVINQTQQPNLYETRAGAENVVVDFATATITRRFYFVINGYNSSWDTSSQEIYIHLWNGGVGTLDNEVWSAKASKMYNDYGNDKQGLWYIDVTAKGVGNTLYAQLKRQGGSDAWSYSSGVQLPSLADKTHDVIWLNNEAQDGNRKATVGTAGGKSGEVASFVNFVTTCSDSYANGYNAYPQLNANFFIPSAGEISAYGDGTYVEDKDDEQHNYTLTHKINELEKQYNKKGWIVE